jgi:hypothetical protein
MSLLVVILAVATPSTAQAQRIPMRVVIEQGWNTNVDVIAPIPADSEIGREFPNQRMVIGFAYDQYWFIIPIWNSRGSFIICEEFTGSKRPEEYFILKDQSAEAISAAAGVPADGLRKPFLYYVPWGWLLPAAIAVIVKLTSGPGPHERFRRLWREPRYRSATARLLGVEESQVPADFETIVLVGPPTDPSARFDEVVTWLVQQGVSRRRSARDLDFIARYLFDNHKLTLVAPPDETSPPIDSGSERDLGRTSRSAPE